MKSPKSLARSAVIFYLFRRGFEEPYVRGTDDPCSVRNCVIGADE